MLFLRRRGPEKQARCRAASPAPCLPCGGSEYRTNVRSFGGLTVCTAEPLAPGAPLFPAGRGAGGSWENTPRGPRSPQGAKKGPAGYRTGPARFLAPSKYYYSTQRFKSQYRFCTSPGRGGGATQTRAKSRPLAGRASPRQPQRPERGRRREVRAGPGGTPGTADPPGGLAPPGQGRRRPERGGRRGRAKRRKGDPPQGSPQTPGARHRDPYAGGAARRRGGPHQGAAKERPPGALTRRGEPPGDPRSPGRPDAEPARPLRPRDGDGDKARGGGPRAADDGTGPPWRNTGAAAATDGGRSPASPTAGGPRDEGQPRGNLFLPRSARAQGQTRRVPPEGRLRPEWGRAPAGRAAPSGIAWAGWLEPTGPRGCPWLSWGAGERSGPGIWFIGGAFPGSCGFRFVLCTRLAARATGPRSILDTGTLFRHEREEWALVPRRSA